MLSDQAAYEIKRSAEVLGHGLQTLGNGLIGACMSVDRAVKLAEKLNAPKKPTKLEVQLAVMHVMDDRFTSVDATLCDDLVEAVMKLLEEPQ